MCFGSQRGKRACDCFPSLPSINVRKGSLQDDIPTVHTVAYLPAWYLTFFFLLRVALILLNPFSASTSSLLLRKLAVLLVTWPVLGLTFLGAIPIFQINAHLSAFFPLKVS